MIEIPNYTIENELGRGGMATVYLAVQDMLSRHVALKIMLPDMARDENFRKSFLSEGKIIANLEHTNIVRVHDVGMIDDSILYMAMEYLAGGTLKEKLSDRSLSYAESLRILEQASSGLAYAHAKGYIHRDVKPGNILFRDNGTAVLTDFGIAKLQDTSGELTRMGYTMGTVQYMSPEQAVTTDLDQRSDIYSLGLVFYEMLTGQKAFKAESTIQAIHQHTTVAPPKLPEKYGFLQGAIDKVLAKDPNDRYQTIEDFVDAVKRSADVDETVIRKLPIQDGFDRTQTLRPNQATSDTKKSKKGLFIGITGAGVLLGALAFGSTKYPDVVAWLDEKGITDEGAEKKRLAEIEKREEEKRLVLTKAKAKERQVIEAEDKEKKISDAKRKEGEKQVAETKKEEEEKRLLEAKLKEEKQVIEAEKRDEEEKQLAEAKRKAEETQIAEIKKKEEEKRLAESETKEEERLLAAAKQKEKDKRIIEAKKKDEEERLLAAKKEEKNRLAEAEREEREKQLAETEEKEDEEQVLAAKKKEEDKRIATAEKKEAKRVESAKIVEERKRVENSENERKNKRALAKKKAEKAAKKKKELARKKAEKIKKQKANKLARKKAEAKRKAQQQAKVKAQIRVSATLNGRPLKTSYILMKNNKYIQTISGRSNAVFSVPPGRYTVKTQYAGKVSLAVVNLGAYETAVQSFAFRGKAAVAQKPQNKADPKWSHTHKPAQPAVRKQAKTKKADDVWYDSKGWNVGGDQAPIQAPVKQQKAQDGGWYDSKGWNLN